MQAHVDEARVRRMAEQEKGVVDAGCHEVSNALLCTASSDESPVRITQQETHPGAGLGLPPQQR